MELNRSKWTLVVAANNELVLENTLLRSPDIDSRCQLLIKRGFPSAASAYNCGLSEAISEVVVLAHQDVYFPKGWKENLDRTLKWLATRDPEWGALGVFGITRSAKAEPFGHCYSTGLQRVLGAPFGNPIRAQTLDELVLVVRLSSGLRFDEKLPGFHLYGADLCLQACVARMDCYIIPAFCIHNSNGVKYLSWGYWRSYFYMRRKWWNLLPITTCCSLISRSLKPVIAQIISDAKQWMSGGRQVGARCDDVVSRYDALVTTGDVHCTQSLSAEEYV
jgi:glycosyltransferase involved in cell wall biosynthesis